LATVVPASRTGRRLALIAVVDALGTGAYYTGSALYFTTIVGLAPSQVGAGLAAGGVAGLMCAIPVGMVADRMGAGRVLIGLQLWRAACYAAYCLTSNFAQFLVVAACIGITDAATPPNYQAAVGVAVPEQERVDTLAKVRAVRNVGFGLGALATTAAISEGSRVAYVLLVGGNAVSFLLTALLLRAIGVARLRAASTGANRRPFRLAVEPRYAVAALLNGALAVHISLLSVGLPLWLVGHTTVPAVVLGPLVATNTVLAVLLQARFARPAAQVPGATRCAVLAGLALAAFGVTLQLTGWTAVPATAAGLAVVAVLFLTFGELWQSASGWTISYELAPDTQRAQYLSTFQLGTSLQAILAPWLITSLVFPAAGGWLVFAAMLLVVGLAVPVVVNPGRMA
jgi:MFS family permease